MAKLVGALHSLALATTLAAGSAVAQSAAEQEAWEAAVASGQPAAFLEFLRKYPDSSLTSDEFEAAVERAIAQGSGSSPSPAGESTTTY